MSSEDQREAIVCVDDEPLVLAALRRTLRSRLGRHYSIELARNGAEALELIEELSREQVRPPNTPARWKEPRQVMFGLSLRF